MSTSDLFQNFIKPTTQGIEKSPVGESKTAEHEILFQNFVKPADEPREMELAINLIKKFEGYRDKAYLCPANVWTIGIGTTYYPDYSKVKQGDVCNEQEAFGWASWYIEKEILDPINRKPPVSSVYNSLNCNQRAAIIDFCYNLGVTNFFSSTLLKVMQENIYDVRIRTELAKWTKANGVTLQGLVNRRNAEIELYFS